MRKSDRVGVSNWRNGARLQTYIFRGAPGSGAIELNGAAAHLVEPGDRVIVMHFALMTDDAYAQHHPKVAIIDADNSVEQLLQYDHKLRR